MLFVKAFFVGHRQTHMKQSLNPACACTHRANICKNAREERQGEHTKYYHVMVDVGGYTGCHFPLNIKYRGVDIHHNICGFFLSFFHVCE